jgi:hypothetical protein
LYEHNSYSNRKLTEGNIIISDKKTETEYTNNNMYIILKNFNINFVIFSKDIFIRAYVFQFLMIGYSYKSSLTIWDDDLNSLKITIFVSNCF